MMVELARRYGECWRIIQPVRHVQWVCELATVGYDSPLTQGWQLGVVRLPLGELAWFRGKKCVIYRWFKLLKWETSRFPRGFSMVKIPDFQLELYIHCNWIICGSYPSRKAAEHHCVVCKRADESC